MSWFEDEINAGDSYQEVADPWSAPSGDGGYAPSVEELSESVQLAFGGYDDPTQDRVGSGTPEGQTAWWQAVFSPTEGRQAGPAASPAAQPQQESRGLIGRITDFANQNKSLTEMVLKGIGGAVTAKNTQKAATAQLQEKDRLEQQRNAQYSASISNLAKPGIIGRQQALRRIDGTPVFNNGRIA